MAKLGNVEYPEMPFGSALETVQTVRREKITTVEALANRMGHKSASSGTFFVKMAALNKYYGLVSQNKTMIDLTERAHRILVGMSEEEKAAARREAIENVPLFRALYSKLGSDYHKADFAPLLRDLSGAPVNEVQEVASTVQRLYDDAVSYLGPASASETREARAQELTAPQIEVAPPDVIVLQVPGRPRITVPYERLFVKSIREYLEQLEKELERKGRDRRTAETPSGMTEIIDSGSQ